MAEENLSEDVLAEADNLVDTDDDKPTVAPELSKYWEAVRENPSDFTGWTYLLQYVEQESDVGHAREAFDAFFTHYPYCYGYWKKYADLEKKNDNMHEAEQVFEKGLRGIPLSVDLWTHYISFYKTQYGQGTDAQDSVRRVYERAITASGTDFRSDKLWDSYITWETDNDMRKTVALYDRLLAIPTQLYSHHFEKFKTLVQENHPKEYLSLDEFLKLRAEVAKELLSTETVSGDDEGPPGDSLPPPGDDIPPPGDDIPPPGDDVPPPGDTTGVQARVEETTSTAVDESEVAAIKKVSSFYKGDEKEIQGVRDKVVSLRQAIHRVTEEEVSKRWTFEEGIRRPYFHVKPLEKTQTKNWVDYLDFEIENSSHERTVVLFERCLIACALNEDLWIKYSKYLEAHSVDGVRNVFQRACSIHLPKKALLHLQWAAFEERQGNLSDASQILENIEKSVPGLAMIALRRIALLRRKGDLEETSTLYQSYIDGAPNATIASFYCIKYARYLNKVCKNPEKAKEIINTAIDKDKNNVKLYLQLLDIEYQTPVFNIDSFIEVITRVQSNNDLSQQHQVMFSRRKLEILEEFSPSIEKVLEAYEKHQILIKENKEVDKKRKSEDDKSSDATASDSKKQKTDAVSSVAKSSTTNGYEAYNYGAQAQSQGDTTSHDYYNQWGAYNQGYYGQPQAWSGYGSQYGY